MSSATPAGAETAGQRRRTVAAAGHTGDTAAVTAGLVDADPAVRATALGALARLGRLGPDQLAVAAADEDAIVRRRACELAPTLGPRTVAGLVAALGAIGDPAGLVFVLAATSDKPAVRRRAVLALAPFDGPEVDAALARGLTDRDWQVRQAAEDLIGAAGDIS